VLTGLVSSETIAGVDDEQLADEVLGLLGNAIPIRRVEVILT